MSNSKVFCSYISHISRFNLTLVSQQAVESLDEFTEFDENFIGNFPSELPKSFPTKPFTKSYNGQHELLPPHIVFERDHAFSYDHVPTVSSYGGQRLPPTSYDSVQTIHYPTDDEDGPERNALLYLSPNGPKVGKNCGKLL